MSTINLRSNNPSGLTNAQIDANFTNLNTDKVETLDCTSINIGNKIVKRDSSGDFAARIITAESINLSSDLTVSGSLTVNGSLTTINSTTITVDDKNIELGSVATPTDQTALNGGITLKGTTDKTIIWDSNSNWSLSENLNIPTGKTYKINNVNILSETALGSSVTSSSLTSVGTLTTGVWNATAISTTKGGTGLTSYNTGDLIYASAPNILSKLAKGTDGQVLKLSSGLPVWSADINTNTTYTLDGSGTTNSVNIELIAGGSGSGTDSINLKGSGATEVSWDEVAQRITISSTDTTYTLDGSGTTNSVNIELIAGGSGSGTDSINLKGSGATEVSWDEVAQRITISSTDTNTTYTASTGLTLTGTAFSVNYGTTSTTACVGNDSRLSDARTPTVHAHSASDITSGTMSTARLGSGTANSTTFLRGDNTWAVVDSLPSQTGNSGKYLTTDGTTAIWSPVAGGAEISSTTASDNYNIPFTNLSSGALTTAYINSSSLYFNPGTGTLSSTSFNSLSDIRFKSDLKQIQNALDKVKQLTGYTFTMVESSQRSAGVIAQDVQEVQPEAVGGDPEKLTVSYGALTGLIIEAIKELSEKVEYLQNQLFNK